MSGLGFWLLGLVMGWRHALEPDHLVAVSVMVAEGGGFRPAARVGAIWGIGHTVTILLFGTPLLMFKRELPERIQAGFESLVGLMLIALGVMTLWRLWKRRVHGHWHEHGDKRHWHFHQHSPSGHGEHPRAHEHLHPTLSVGWRPLLVGMVHGLAGSGAAAVLVMASAPSLLVGIGYLLLFGISSVVGMTVTAFLLGLPVWLTQRRFAAGYFVLLILTGTVSLVFGANLLWKAAKIAIA